MNGIAARELTEAARTASLLVLGSAGQFSLTIGCHASEPDEP
jgi:hypothetical protein